MAAVTNRSWKLQEFTAHAANVNCLALGHKSGRVMVTGGDDKKVNLWAVGKPTCFMSLSGHNTPIECVQFNKLEELVCAGSRAGALKVWDLEAAKLVRTLNGHRYSIKSIDFHPYGDFLSSGSADCTIKMWDTRKKGVIYTYNGHKGSVNSIKFSPDGQWIASGGEDFTVKIWDLRVGRVLKEFNHHTSAVTCVEFHPHEFLMVSGSLDRSVNFMDLENFSLVSSEDNLGAVRCLCFNPDGECLFTGVRDYCKVVGWEPNRLFDSVPVNWGRVSDISTAQNQLIGASFHLTKVQVFVVDLKKVQPLLNNASDAIPSPFMPNQNIRKSFSKAERPVSLKTRNLDGGKITEESTSGTDPEEESIADITNIGDYNEIFKGRGLSRTPPPEPEPFQEPEKDFSDVHDPQILTDLRTESFEALSLDTINNYENSEPPAVISSQYNRSKSNLDQVYISRLSRQNRENILPSINKPKPVQKNHLQRQSSCKDVPEKPPKDNMKHSLSDVNLSKGTGSVSRNSSRKNSFSKPNNTKIPNLSAREPRKSVVSSANTVYQKEITKFESAKDEYYFSSKLAPEEKSEEQEDYVPCSVDKPVGLILDDFLPRNSQSLGFQQHLPDMSEAEFMGVVMRGHNSMMGILNTRQRSLKLVLAQYRSKDMKAAVESAAAMGDISVLVDMLGVINYKNSLWSLDLSVLVLPKLEELLQSKYESYMITGCSTLKIVLKSFGSLIKSNIACPVGSFGVDIPREERYNKCVKCHEALLNLKPYVEKKQALPGNVGAAFKEVHTMLKTVMD